ncbi:MAG TPA: peptidylprolyl isomerase [Candidatus Lumbricidophila sp.]|nr:peptidylprolyl isomerase [Candidatus Lumbricidophila sp.]
MASNDRQTREERTRLRNYQARQAVHQHKIRRRRRDNIIGAIGAVVLLATATGAQLLYFGAGPGAPAPTTPGTSATATPTATAGGNSGSVPDKSLAEQRTWTGTLTINGIALGVELDGAAAPQAVASTVSLAKAGFYDGVKCHRLTTQGIFVLQCGDPKGDGTGGPGYSYGPVENAPADNVYKTGVLAMARVGNDAHSIGSQFFIVYADSTIPSDSAGGYTVIGKITSGLEQLQSTVVAQGVAGGASDGAPVVATKIDTLTLK